MVSSFRFILLAFLCGCSLTVGDPVSGNLRFYLVEGPGYRFSVDLTRFQRMDFNRKIPSDCQVNYEVKTVKRNGNDLTLEINRPKGCTGIYELVWDGLWQESYPRRMQLYLTASFNSCSPGIETETDVIRVDLEKAIKETSADLFTIYLREYCSFRDFNCEGNCNLIIPD